MNIERILLPTILLGISSLSLYSCRNGELRSSGNQNSNIADGADSANSQDSHYNLHEISTIDGDELTSEDRFTLDSHLEGGDYDSILDLESKITPDSYFETPFRIAFDSHPYENEVDSLETTIETQPMFCIDKDSDGYGINCVSGSDCNDNDSSTSQVLTCSYDGNVCGEYSLCIDMCPKLPSEKCDGIDNNCNGEIDEGYDPTPAGCWGLGWYEEYESPCSEAINICVNGKIYKYFDDDIFESCSSINLLCPTYFSYFPCDNLTYTCNSWYFKDPCEPPEYPDEESCDGLDNNCNGLVDDIVLENSDYCKKQGVCSEGKVLTFCEEGKWLCSYEFVPYYESEELHCDGVDNDCDGSTDEGIKKVFYEDLDGDGFGNPSKTIEDCIVPKGYIDNNLDCDDDNPFIHDNC